MDISAHCEAGPPKLILLRAPRPPGPTLLILLQSLLLYSKQFGTVISFDVRNKVDITGICIYERRTKKYQLARLPFFLPLTCTG